jgi:hypothetical protein
MIGGVQVGVVRFGVLDETLKSNEKSPMKTPEAVV